jgi:hypothetical protein
MSTSNDVDIHFQSATFRKKINFIEKDQEKSEEAERKEKEKCKRERKSEIVGDCWWWRPTGEYRRTRWTNRANTGDEKHQTPGDEPSQLRTQPVTNTEPSETPEEEKREKRKEEKRKEQTILKREPRTRTRTRTKNKNENQEQEPRTRTAEKREGGDGGEGRRQRRAAETAESGHHRTKMRAKAQLLTAEAESGGDGGEWPRRQRVAETVVNVFRPIFLRGYGMAEKPTKTK